MPFGFDKTASTAASTGTLLAATSILKLAVAFYSWYSSVVVKDGRQQSVLLLSQQKGHRLVPQTLQTGAFQHGCARFQARNQRDFKSSVRKKGGLLHSINNVYTVQQAFLSST